MRRGLDCKGEMVLDVRGPLLQLVPNPFIIELVVKLVPYEFTNLSAFVATEKVNPSTITFDQPNIIPIKCVKLFNLPLLVSH